MLRDFNAIAFPRCAPGHACFSQESESSGVRILAVETTERIASVAALQQGQLLHQQTTPPEQRSAQALAPAIQSVLEHVAWQPSDVQLVAVPVGPGSFTGLRVGVTTAKTFAYAVEAEVLGVNTLEVIAQLAPAEIGELEVVMDAQRQQLFAGRFARDTSGHFQWRETTHIVNEADWLARLATSPVAVTGPGLRKLRARLPENTPVVDPAQWAPTAAAVGELAWRMYEAGQRDDLWKLAPQYFRASAAEDKWRERHGQ